MISIDLPSHGDSPLFFTAYELIIQACSVTILSNSVSVLKPLLNENKVTNLDAIAGYSLGGAQRRNADDKL